MEFDDAIRLDNRKFCKYFSDNLKQNQIITNTFCLNEPFKPRSLKIIIFILYILLYFVINALFINDDYVSKIYNSKKKENFFSFIPRTIERVFEIALISFVLEFIVDFFSVKEKKMKGIFKREKSDEFLLKNEILNLVKRIEVIYVGFIIFIFGIYIISFYHIICFISIYPKMQVEWIKSSIFIFILRQILSVFQCLAEASLRIISFHFESEKIFKVSKLVN